MTEHDHKQHDHFLRLFMEHEESLRVFVRSLLFSRDEEREVMQEVAIVLWRKFDAGMNSSAFCRWAFGVARMEVLAFRRDRHAIGTALATMCSSCSLAVLKKIAMSVYESGMENAGMVMDRGVPHGVGQWGADFATVVTAENGVQPLKGQGMLRLEAIPRDKNVKNLASRVYQVLDLRSLAMNGIVSDAEVLVSASFCPANADVGSRYLIRAFALKETPEQATKGFWPKTEDDGVVSVAQRFEVSPGERGWHTFSLKMSLPLGAQSLVFILGAVPTEDMTAEASQHYLDDVRVSVITSQAILP